MSAMFLSPVTMGKTGMTWQLERWNLTVEHKQERRRNTMGQIKPLRFLVVIVALSLFFVSIGGGIASAASHPISHYTTVDWQSLIERANPYVKVVNDIAAIDPQINQHLSTDEVVLVKQAANRYNSLPLSIRQHGRISGTVILHKGNIGNSGGGFQWTCYVEWWGVRCWIDSYAAQFYGNFLAIVGGAIGAAIGALLGGVAGSLILGILFGLGGYTPAFDDTYCHYHGVFIDIPWIFTAAHFTKVC